MIFNHITVRVPPECGSSSILSACIIARSRASNLVLIDTEGNAVRETKWPVNRAGFVIHSAIHGALSDAHCVMHTHTTTGVAVASLKEGLSPNNFYGAMLVGQVAYHEFEGITVEPDEKDRLVKSIGKKPAVILRNHGLLAWGPSVSQAFVMLWTLQRACDVQIALLPPGRSIRSGPRCSRRRCARAVPPRSAPATTCSRRCSVWSMRAIRPTAIDVDVNVNWALP